MKEILLCGLKTHYFVYYLPWNCFCCLKIMSEILASVTYFCNKVSSHTLPLCFKLALTKCRDPDSNTFSSILIRYEFARTVIDPQIERSSTQLHIEDAQKRLDTFWRSVTDKREELFYIGLSSGASHFSKSFLHAKGAKNDHHYLWEHCVLGIECFFNKSTSKVLTAEAIFQFNFVGLGK